MSLKKSLLIIALFVLVLAAFSYQNSSEHKVLFEKAKFTMETKGDMKGAIKLFEEIIEKYPDERDYAAKSQLYVGLCYEKLGLKLAQEAFQKVVDNYPDQTETVNMAKEKLSILLRAQKVVEKGDEEFKMTKIHTDKRRWGILSPDEKKLALIDNVDLGDIWLRDIESGKEVHLTNDPVMILGLSWSWDSKKIAYYNLAWDIKVVSAEGGVSKTIVEIDQESEKAGHVIMPKGWTSDSKKVIFQHTAKGLFAVPASGGKWEKIFAFQDPKKANEYGWMSLSPDGKFIAYDSKKDDNKDIHLMPVGGGESTRITHNPASDGWPQWSYNGKWISFTSERTEKSEIWVIQITADGKPGSKPIQVSQGGMRNAVWTKAGNIAYLSYKGTAHIFTAYLDGSEEIQVTKFKGGAYPRWSPDGRKIAYVADYGEEWKRAIWIVPSDGGDEKFLTIGEFPVWSPDGKKIAFRVYTQPRPPFKAKISIIKAEGGEPKELMSYDGGLRNLDWSPDGKHIAFSYARGIDLKNPIPDSRIGIEDIYIVPVDGGEPKRLTKMDKKGFQFTSPRWSPDGKKIAFISIDYETWAKEGKGEPVGTWTIAIKGGETKLITRGLLSWVLSWSPDGKYIISSKEEEDSAEPGLGKRFYKVPVEGGEPEKLNIIGGGPDLSPDGKKIAFAKSVDFIREFWLVENFLSEENR